ncbi:NEDD4-binding protein 2-like 1 isoform X1 [Oncorhynchus tshawytscha]|uniref:NEDD4-binding protein 2-like 1 isoform X1 n=1 Tax=Oncorhynchus tshawytscha TaxID=74940 RepID=UPI001C3CFE91|nr:NEDD4-binding protein 2-like 1 isoform X1 [Oncorhynchus tshawytscha]
MVNGRGRKRCKKNLIIIRGLPGVGKKPYARKLLDKFGCGQMFSASYYHAKFNWNRQYFSRNHMWNRRDVFRAMEEGVDPIIVYNIHSFLSDMWPYITMGMRQGDYQITMMELPQGYPNNPFPINQLYRICHCKIPKVKFRFWEDNWQEAADIWDVLNDSSSIYRWQYSREEWNLY